jgi:hypothetical protein
VEIYHLRDVHSVDVIRSENSNNIRRRLLDQIDVLINRIGSTLIPGSSPERIWAGTGMMN